MDDIPHTLTLVSDLRKRREECGDSQSSAAEKLNTTMVGEKTIDKTVISKLEHREFGPSRQLAMAIWRVYGIHPDAWDRSDPVAEDLANASEAIEGAA